MNIHEHSLSSLANQYHNPWRHGHVAGNTSLPDSRWPTWWSRSTAARSDEKWQVSGQVSGSFRSFHDEDLNISDVLGCFGDLNWIVIFFWNNPLLKSRKLRHSSEICRTRKRKLKWLGRNGRSWDRWQQNSAGDGVQWFLLRRLVEAGSMKFDQPRQFSLWSRRASREVAGTGWICWGLGRSSHADNFRHAARNPAPAQQLIALRPQYSCSARKQIEFGPACLIAFRLDLHAFIHTNDSMISYDVWQQYTALHCTALTLQCLRIITLPRIKKHVMLLLGDVRFEV
jgi:hypothetical protein